MSFKITSRCFHSSIALWRNHYETLGVSRKATHSEIKSAYYKLSMQFHPDRQDGNRERFEQINNAYKIIGDSASRALYDRGAFQEIDAPPPTRNYHSQTGPVRRSEVYSGKTPIYDFDMWSRQHYGQTIERRNAAKEKYEHKTNRKTGSHVKKENVTLSLLASIFFIGAITIAYRKLFDNFDNPPNKGRGK